MPNRTLEQSSSSPPDSVCLLWFRQDLRLADQPALRRAAQHKKVIAVYVLDDDNARAYAIGAEMGAEMGAASRSWLHRSLAALNEALDKRYQASLNFYRGPADEIIQALCVEHEVTHVEWNRCYEPWRIERDKQLKQSLVSQGIQVSSHSASLLLEPWQLLKSDGTPYKVFTPFYRRALSMGADVEAVLSAPPVHLNAIADHQSLPLEALELTPRWPWDEGFYAKQDVGEQAALVKLHDFLDSGLQTYKKGRDFPAQNSVSQLSPHLHYGEICPQRMVHETLAYAREDNSEHFVRELYWREFAYYCMYHFPSLLSSPLQPKFRWFPWREIADNNEETELKTVFSSDPALKAWQQGKTGYPIIDAGMRELWQTGLMHNRVRMVVASFLVKNLLIHPHHGRDWFWQCLIDADLASNSVSWQWVAGSGVDAAPYFRVFNPVTQAQRFDPQGDYIKQYVPALRDLDAKYIAAPWLAPSSALEQAGIEIGGNYPAPMVDVKQSRIDALEAYQQMKSNAAWCDDQDQ